MTNDSKSSKQDQSNDLQILSSLLIKERSVESSTKIKDILASDNDLQEKIKLIRILDNELKKGSESPENHSSPAKKPAPEKPDSDETEKESESPAYLSQHKKKHVPVKPDSDFVVDSIFSIIYLS